MERLIGACESNFRRLLTDRGAVDATETILPEVTR
jgi:hypothetical protein